jgi:hypothetical protein
MIRMWTFHFVRAPPVEVCLPVPNRQIEVAQRTTLKGQAS